MVNFILDLIIMVSLGVLLYLVVRTLPRIDDVELDDSEIKTHWLVFYIEKADEKFKTFNEKFLRRCKVVTLKIDNYLGGKLTDFKKDNNRNEEIEFDFVTTDEEPEREVSSSVTKEEEAPKDADAESSGDPKK